MHFLFGVGLDGREHSSGELLRLLIEGDYGLVVVAPAWHDSSTGSAKLPYQKSDDERIRFRRHIPHSNLSENEFRLQAWAFDESTAKRIDEILDIMARRLEDFNTVDVHVQRADLLQLLLRHTVDGMRCCIWQRSKVSPVLQCQIGAWTNRSKFARFFE